MSYRPATYTDIINHLLKQEQYEHFQETAAFADALYGAQAATVHVHVCQDWDFDGPSTMLESITVYDERGRELLPDFTLPDWSEYQEHLPADFATLSFEEQLSIARDFIEMDRLPDHYFQDLPDESTLYELRKPPEEPEPLYIQE